MDNEMRIRLEELDDGTLDRAQADIQSELASGRSKLAELHWEAVRDHATGALNKEIANFDWLGCIGRAWATATKLRELATKTKAAPGKEEPLPLKNHDLSVDTHPIVTIHCGPISLPPVRFTLRLDAAVKCAILVVADGKLVALEGATLTPSAKLYYDTRLLKELAGQELPITGRYTFANGGIEIATD